MKFKLGDQVRNRHYNEHFGTIIEITTNSIYPIRVRWDTTGLVIANDPKWLRKCNGLEVIKQRHDL